MSNERILSYKMSKKLDWDEVTNVSGGSSSKHLTQGGTGKYYNPDDSWDYTFDA